MNNISVKVAWLSAAVFMWIAFIEFSSNFFNVEKEFFDVQKNQFQKLVHTAGF
jgi:hypothetical protein